MTDNASWRKATYSNGSGNCVEVGCASDAILVRDTKVREDGPVLRVDTDAWARFATAIKR